MMRLALALVCLLPSAGLAAGGWGTLRGRFVYDGPHPAPQKLNVPAGLLLVCGRQNIYDESLQVGPRGGIANIVLWVHTKGLLIHPRYEKEADKRVVYDNRGCRFSPHVLPLWTSQTLELHIADPIRGARSSGRRVGISRLAREVGLHLLCRLEQRQVQA
jgi:hypothetical protein